MRDSVQAGTDGEFVRDIRVYIVGNRQTGLLVALSDDMKGLMVAGRTEEQIELELPDAIREILEAEGHRVTSVCVFMTIT